MYLLDKILIKDCPYRCPNHYQNDWPEPIQASATHLKSTSRSPAASFSIPIEDPYRERRSSAAQTWGDTRTEQQGQPYPSTLAYSAEQWHDREAPAPWAIGIQSEDAMPGNAGKEVANIDLSMSFWWCSQTSPMVLAFRHPATAHFLEGSACALHLVPLMETEVHPTLSQDGRLGLSWREWKWLSKRVYC